MREQSSALKDTSFEYNGSEETDLLYGLKTTERINSAFLDPSALLDNTSQQWEIWRWVVR